MKKVLSMLCAFVLCTIVALPAEASSSKPAVEITQFTMSMNSIGGVSTTLSFRNNSGKVIKYIDLTVSAYNRVDDRVGDEITGKSTCELRVVGPFSPFFVSADWSGDIYVQSSATGTPFNEYRMTPYAINDNQGNPQSVYLDKYNNFFVKPANDATHYVYLSDYEINNIMYDYNTTIFENIMYNPMISYLKVDSAVITYMDNTTQTLSGNTMFVDCRYHTLQNEPFILTVARYSAVYNYNDYKALNPDLDVALGGNEKLLFEHFINNGMKEGRQGSIEFNLAAYKANNPDVVAALGDDNVKYYEHYISSGKAEGRKAV